MNFFLKNCEGFILEMSENINYLDDLSFAEVMGYRWLA